MERDATVAAMFDVQYTDRRTSQTKLDSKAKARTRERMESKADRSGLCAILVEERTMEGI